MDADAIRAMDEATKQFAGLESQAPRNLAAVEQRQRELGQSLFEVLDGPDRRLRRHFETAARLDEPLSLTIRLLDKDAHHPLNLLHPAVRWRWALLHDGARF